MPTRRTFLSQASAFAMLAKVSPLVAQQAMQHDRVALPAAPPAVQKTPLPAMLHSLELPSFVDPLPLPRRIAPGHRPLRIAMREVYAKVHRDVVPTRFWTYMEASDTKPTALAPVIEARAHQPLHVEWLNQLPAQHFLPIDHSLHGCGTDIPDVRTVVHVHGGRTPPASDGYPTDWFPVHHSRSCTYPLPQEAAGLWYHDHAMGINRLNSYAGMFGHVFVRDSVEDALQLPSGPHELPLFIYDRDFTADGQLFYPTSGDPAHPWITEFYADAVLVNGKIRPYFDAEPRLYRLRIVNSSNSRFLPLALSNHEPLHQIGSDQGLLAATVPMKTLLLAPGERADVLLDLSGAAGRSVRLLNSISPILEFRVAATKPIAVTIPTTLRPIARLPESSAILTRSIALNEFHDKMGAPMLMLLNGKHWHEPVTERPRLGTTEIWEFVNLTEDTHPMHLHLVRFQVLDRRQFDVFAYQNSQGTRYLAPAAPPEPNELGWKDIVQCHPGTITRIIVPFEGYTGSYLYHCHVLEHEANDMMRPYEVIA